MDERTMLCNQLAVECSKILNDKLKEIAQLLKPGMETGYFFRTLDNNLTLHFLAYQVKNEMNKMLSAENEVDITAKKSSVDKSMFWPTDDDEDDRYSPHPLDNLDER